MRPFEEVAAEVKARARDQPRGEPDHRAARQDRGPARRGQAAGRDREGVQPDAAHARPGRCRPAQGRRDAGRGRCPAATPPLQAIFRSDIGVDNEAIRLPRDTGYVWYDVTKIDPARERSFDEVKAQVETQWRADEVASRLSAKARELVERLDTGEAFDAVAASAGLTIEQAADLGRQDQRPELPANVVTPDLRHRRRQEQLRRGPDGGRILFKVDAATVPSYVRTTQEAENFVRLLASSVSEDILTAVCRKAAGGARRQRSTRRPSATPPAARRTDDAALRRVRAFAAGL